MSKHLTRVAAIFTLLAFLVTASCSKQTGSSPDSNIEYWTCTMHPSVHSKDPGKCPICSMDLVPVMKKSGEAKPSPAQGQQEKGGGEMPGMPGMKAGEMKGMPGMPGMKGGAESKTPQTSEFIVPVERQQQIGVNYAKVERKPLTHTIRSVGMIVPDSRNWQFVSRRWLRLKLNVTSPGQVAKKTQGSVDLQPQFANERARSSCACATRRRAKTARNTAAANRISQTSAATQNVTEQQVVDPEEHKASTRSLCSRRFAAWCNRARRTGKERQRATGRKSPISASSGCGRMLRTNCRCSSRARSPSPRSRILAKTDGTIALIDPFINETKRGQSAHRHSERGFQAAARFRECRTGDGHGRSAHGQSAIMPTGERNVVFIDKGGGKLEPRIVQLGAKYGDIYEVQSGLQEGERVVSSANFLIDAESKVQGALKDFEQEKPKEAAGSSVKP
jgi:Cu(I)/Ag(I) efflux system membrane fusion protein